MFCKSRYNDMVVWCEADRGGEAPSKWLFLRTCTMYESRYGNPLEALLLSVSLGLGIRGRLSMCVIAAGCIMMACRWASSFYNYTRSLNGTRYIHHPNKITRRVCICKVNLQIIDTSKIQNGNHWCYIWIFTCTLSFFSKIWFIEARNAWKIY